MQKYRRTERGISLRLKKAVRKNTIKSKTQLVQALPFQGELSGLAAAICRKSWWLTAAKTSLSTFVDDFLFTRSRFCLIMICIKGESERAVIALARPPFSYLQTILPRPRLYKPEAESESIGILLTICYNEKSLTNQYHPKTNPPKRRHP